MSAIAPGSDNHAPRGAPDADALTVAMSIAPGVYSRNRFFELFRGPEVRRARSRAALVRGIVQHLALLGREGGGVATAVTLERCAGRVVFRYAIASLRFERRAELSELEAACVLFVSHRAGIPGLEPSSAELDALHVALLRLSGGLAGRLLR